MAASIPVLRSLVREVTGSSGRAGCPLNYVVNKSRDAASKVRSRHASMVASRRSKITKHSSGTEGDDEVVLHEASTASGQIIRMEEVHVQFADREADGSIDSEIERIPRSYQPWV